MAASTSAIPFDSFTVKVSDTTFKAVEGLESCSLELTQDLHETTAAVPSYWQDYCKGERSWVINLNGGWVETNPECGAGATINFDGTNSAKGIASYTLSLEADTINVSSFSSAGVREVLPGRRKGGVSFDGIYFDPAGTGANWSGLLANVNDGTTSCTVDLNFGSTSEVTGTAYGRTLNITRDDNDAVKLAGDLSYTGAITLTTAGATILEKMIDAWTAGTEVTFQITDGASGSTTFLGSGYMVSFSIEVPYNGKITWSAQVAGDGALNDYTYNT